MYMQGRIINPHSELPSQLMDGECIYCIWLISTSSRSGWMQKHAKTHMLKIQMRAHTQTTHRDIPAVAHSRLTMAISIVCVDTHGIDFPWQRGPSIATNIGLQSHHVDTEHNHFCLSALFLWHNKKKEKKKDKDWRMSGGMLHIICEIQR